MNIQYLLTSYILGQAGIVYHQWNEEEGTQNGERKLHVHFSALLNNNQGNFWCECYDLRGHILMILQLILADVKAKV